VYPSIDLILATIVFVMWYPDTNLQSGLATERLSDGLAVAPQFLNPRMSRL
jgi:hypothetical protein